MKKVIITGPTGAVGVSLTEELIAHDDLRNSGLPREFTKYNSNSPKSVC